MPGNLDLILRHSTLGIALMVFPIRRLAAVAISSQIGCNYREMLCKSRGDFSPFDVRLRPTVQQLGFRSREKNAKFVSFLIPGPVLR
jgi:adenine C2-methylase RlmN of 23S rRNA A2503 and tRNA A37